MYDLSIHRPFAEDTEQKISTTLKLLCLKGKFGKIRTPWGDFGTLHIKGGYFDLGNFINQMAYAIKSLPGSDDEKTCEKSKAMDILKHFGSVVQKSDIVPYFQHTFLAK